MPRIALGLEYEGSSFCGWQTQPSGCGVQDALERALSQLANEKIFTICAGRTDAGVHALAQVVHFDSNALRSESAWVRGTNSLLPPRAAVIWARPVSETFNARYDARERRYRYMLLNHPQRPALDQKRVGWLHAPLDLAPMQEAARDLIGQHDFSAFRAAECQAKSPIRELRRLDITRRGDYFVFELAANAFLQHMVRNIVGSLLYIGKGKYPPAWMQEVLASRRRDRAAPTADPAGLYLARVVYDAIWELPEGSRKEMTITQCDGLEK
jgi:tRNA pseudouridine38-40 synthase